MSYFKKICRSCSCSFGCKPKWSGVTSQKMICSFFKATNTRALVVQNTCGPGRNRNGIEVGGGGGGIGTQIGICCFAG